jgi:FkbM family methyltransferase
METFTNIEFESLLNNSNVFFIQIGANDGISVDPINKLIKKYNWGGILFEPGEDAFRELQKNYQDVKNLTFVNAAVSNYDGFGSLFCGTTTPHFTLNSQKAKDMFCVEPVAKEVQIVSPKSIIEKYNVTKLDLLQIDAEGHDFTIIKAFPFNVLKPSVIRFEYVNLSYDNEGESSVINFFNSKGYTVKINREEGDMIAILNK